MMAGRTVTVARLMAETDSRHFYREELVISANHLESREVKVCEMDDRQKDLSHRS